MKKRDWFIDVTLYLQGPDDLSPTWVSFERYQEGQIGRRSGRDYRTPTETSLLRLSRWISDHNPKVGMVPAFRYCKPFGWISLSVRRPTEPCKHCGSWEIPVSDSDLTYCRNCGRLHH